MGSFTEYAPLILGTAQENGIPAGLLAALVQWESGFNPNAVSPAGAVGLTQLMPGTARGLGLRVDDQVDERYDPAKNLLAGARYLRQQLDAFGSYELALAAYNAGPGAVRQYGGIPPFEETRKYVSGVMQLWQQQYRDLDNISVPHPLVPIDLTTLALLLSLLAIGILIVLQKPRRTLRS